MATIFGSAGPDTRMGTAANDTLYGGPTTVVSADLVSNDTLNGADGDDVLWGFGGNDQLLGGLGSDQVYGGTGPASAFHFATLTNLPAGFSAADIAVIA